MALLLVLLVVACGLSTTRAFGGEKAFFQTPMMTPSTAHRQNVCDYYDRFRNGTAELPDALQGLKLNTLMGAGGWAYFNYDVENGIQAEYPGLAAEIMDELARRGGFTWRESFAVAWDPTDPEYNSTWDELLFWGIESYDLHVDWWSESTARMKQGVAFVQEFYDSSLILIAKDKYEEPDQGINLWNWLKPYDSNVWMMTMLTILLSALVYQVLEWYADEREERTLWEWSMENVYLSLINATQAYEYQPRTLASRIFGVSMAIWALVMTATYTANLASLLVDRIPPPPGAQSIEEAVVFGDTICVYEGGYDDTYIKTHYPSAAVLKKKSDPELYQGLHDGECDFSVEYVERWYDWKGIRKHNPFCDLYWVGVDRRIETTGAGFATKADSGRLCTNFIRDVLDIHMRDMVEEGWLKDAWEREHARTQNIDCKIYKPGLSLQSDSGQSNPDGEQRGRYLVTSRGRSNLQEEFSRSSLRDNHVRALKAVSGATGGAVASAAANGGGGGEEDERRLTVEQMIGTFAFHWGLMVVALLVAGINGLYTKCWTQKTHKEKAIVPQSGFGAPTVGDGVSGAIEENGILDTVDNGHQLDAQDLQKQLLAMQLHMQQFEEKVMAKLDSQTTETTQTGKSSSLGSGDMPTLEMNGGK